MDAEPSLIAGILARPQDDAPRGRYADWLHDRGDPRSEYLRSELEWAKARTGQAEARVRELAALLDRVWVARVSRPPLGVCADHLRFLDGGLARPQLAPADLDWVETRFAITLPPDYRAYLLNHNGACPEPAHVRLPSWSYGAWCYDQLVGLFTVWAAKESEVDRDDDLVWHLQFLEEARASADPDGGAFAREGCRWAGEPHRNWMVIGDGPPTGELEWFCLGCRGSAIGKVYFAAPDVWSPEVEDYALVAPTFAAFLAMLTDYDPDHLRAIKAGDLAALCRWLEAGGDPNELFQNTPLLQYALMHSRPGVVQELLVRGAKVYDALFAYARQMSSPEVIDLLRSHREPPAEGGR